MINITGVGTVGVPVTDQDRALDFYVGTLGLNKTMDAPFGEGMRWIEVSAPDAPTTIALMPTPPGTPTGVDTAIRLNTPDAAAVHEGLIAAHADVDAEIMNWPGTPPMFSLRDPDGNTLYVVQR